MIADLRSSALGVEQSKQNIIERKLVVARDVRNNFRWVQTDVCSSATATESYRVF